MKKTVILISLLCFIVAVFAQAPQKFKYQTVVRDGSGNILANQSISLEITIREDNAAGPVVYQEEHVGITTNSFGLVSIDIGGGSVISGTFSNLRWGVKPHYIRVGLDAAGGTSYSYMGSNQILSVPYALYAENANDFNEFTYGSYKGLNYTGNLFGIGRNVTETPQTTLTIADSVGAGIMMISEKNTGGPTLFFINNATGEYDYALNYLNTTKTLDVNYGITGTPNTLLAWFDGNNKLFGVKGQVYADSIKLNTGNLNLNSKNITNGGTAALGIVNSSIINTEILNASIQVRTNAITSTNPSITVDKVLSSSANISSTGTISAPTISATTSLSAASLTATSSSITNLTVSSIARTDSLVVTKKTTKIHGNGMNIIASETASPNITVYASTAVGAYGGVIRSTATGNQRVVLPIDVPSKILGNEQKLKSVQIFYRCDVATSYITSTYAVDVTNCTTLTLAQTTTDQTSTSWASYTITCGTPTVVAGTFILVFDLTFGGTGATNDITIAEVIATFE